ncbi:MAG TPA: hypothetical protein VF574_02030 [Allosphingosinicella sp.]
MRVNLGLSLLALVVMTAIGVAADLYPDFIALANIASIIANLILQYEISAALLSHYDLLDPHASGRRLGALLGLNLLSGIGIVFGLILLIVPGIYLIVRWSAAVPALISEGADVTQSLTRSSEAVEGRFWHVFAAIALLWTLPIVAVLASALVPEDQILIASLTLNLPVSLALITGWHLAVAVYAGREGHRGLAEVFA